MISFPENCVPSELKGRGERRLLNYWLNYLGEPFTMSLVFWVTFSPPVKFLWLSLWAYCNIQKWKVRVSSSSGWELWTKGKQNCLWLCILPELTSWLPHLLVMWPCFSFLFCKNSIIVVSAYDSVFKTKWVNVCRIHRASFPSLSLLAHRLVLFDLWRIGLLDALNLIGVGG